MKIFAKSSHGLAGIAGVLFASMTIAAGPPAADAEFRKMDANHDGKITAEEHAAAAKKMFETMDANRDGKVTAAEMTAAHRKVTGKKAKKSDMSSADKIKAIDTDGDGILTADEHAAGSRAMFEKMDTNKDGSLSKAELAAGHAALLKK